MKEPHLTLPTKGKSYVLKEKVEGKTIVVSDSYRENRELNLIIQKSRALLTGEIHELLVCDVDAGPGDTVDNVKYLGFFELTKGGHVVVGDKVFADGKEVGVVAGFNDSHFPNHYNILLRAKKMFTGMEFGLKLGTKIEIVLPD